MHRVFLVAFMRLHCDTVHTRTSCVTYPMILRSRFAPMRLRHGSDAPAAIPDAIDPFMLQRNRSSEEAPKVINPSETKEINNGVRSGSDNQSCAPPARAGRR